MKSTEVLLFDMLTQLLLQIKNTGRLTFGDKNVIHLNNRYHSARKREMNNDKIIRFINILKHNDTESFKSSARGMTQNIEIIS